MIDHKERLPDGVAVLRGSAAYPELRGTVWLYQTGKGAFLVAEIGGLPHGEESCGTPIFAFHIHGGGACTGTGDRPFMDAGSHYDPGNCPHPFHAGDLLPLFGVDGYAFSAVLTGRFRVKEVLGKTVVIHAGRDDFKTQPSGEPGLMIACGVICPFN